jgi:hypothetical protein
MPSEAQHAAPPAPRPSIFLSYASADRAAARLLRDALEAAGLNVWLDEDELGGGEAWDTKIRSQIRQCTYFMPLISATTERRREGYFRREWRLAVERTLDLADDVMFLVPVVVDDTRDVGARVPEKFFTVQWLRVPGGQATAELRTLAGKLATSEAVVVHPTTPIAETARPRSSRKEPRSESGLPPLPPFPAFPEPGHRVRFWYETVLWSGRLIHALWMRLPGFVRIVASIVIVFNVIAWIFRGPSKPITSETEKAAVATALIKTIGPSADAVQARHPLAMVTFGGRSEEAKKYAGEVFSHVLNILVQNNPDKISLSPLPLESDSDDDEALERGTQLESRYVLTGFAQRHAPGDAIILTAKLYDVKQRTVVWSEIFYAAQTDAVTAAQRLVDAAQSRALPAAKP